MSKDIVQKQSIYTTILSYSGVLLGFIGNALIMPKVFSTEEIGFLRVILAIIGVFSGIFSLGIGQLVFRTYHDYVKESKYFNKYFTLFFGIAIIGGLLSFPFYYYYFDIFFEDKSFEDNTNIALFSTVYMLIFSRIIYIYLEVVLKMKMNISLTSFLQNIVIKGAPIILLGLYYFQVITYSNYIYIYLSLFLFLPVILFIKLKKDHEVNLAKPLKITSENRAGFLKLSTFGLLNTVAASVFLYLDTLMINDYLTKSEVGVYTVLYLFGQVINIPSKALKAISGVLIVKNIKDDNWSKVKSINKNGTQFLMVLSSLIFLCIYCNNDFIIFYMGPEYEMGRYVILFIGLAQLFEVFFGFNSEIISATNKYWVHLPFTLLMITLGIISNIIFIPLYGVNGAALATFLSLFFIYGVRSVYTFYRFKISLFDQNILICLIITATLSIISYYLPNLDNFYVDLIVRTFAVVLIYIPLVVSLNISKEFNRQFFKILSFLKLYKNN